MAKTLGIVGGLGTETSCTFCLHVNTAIQQAMDEQPRMIIDNVSMSNKGFRKLARGDFCPEALGLLVDSITRLNQAKVDLIVIPCNTVHVFIETLRRVSNVPILSIINETAKECVRQGFTKVGILGTSLTIQERLHTNALSKHNIDSITPTGGEQQFMDECIFRIINQQSTVEDRHQIANIINNLATQGAQAVILGCTDLFLIADQNAVTVPLINSTAVFEKSAINWFLEEK